MKIDVRELTLSLLVTFGILLGVYFYFSVKPSVFLYRVSPSQLLSKEVKPGENLTMIVDRCNNSSKAIVIITTRKLIHIDSNAAPITLQGNTIGVEPGCKVEENKAIRLPADTADGCYVVQGYVYTPDEFKAKTVPWSTERFCVKR